MMATKKLSDRELNQKLMENMGVKGAEARKAFEDMMNEKYQQIRAEVRKEVYEELSKQAKEDKNRIVESMNQLTNKVIKDKQVKDESSIIDDLLDHTLIKSSTVMALALAKKALDYMVSLVQRFMVISRDYSFTRNDDFIEEGYNVLGNIVQNGVCLLEFIFEDGHREIKQVIVK